MKLSKRSIAAGLVLVLLAALIIPNAKGSRAASASVGLTESGGWFESAYVKWNAVSGASGYNVYVKGSSDSSYKQLDSMLIRKYSSYYRADAVGLKAGTYTMKVVPVISGKEDTSKQAVTGNLKVSAYDRSGFAFVNGSSSGAYNNDGTLKSNAQVIYVTEANKDSVSAEIVTSSKGATTKATGIQNILNAIKKGYDSRPFAIRIVGRVTDPSVLDKGDLTIDSVKNGLTFEGIGNDATLYGWGVRLKNCSNVEIRNIGVMLVDSSEGDNVTLQQGNDHIWVHNFDSFYGMAGSDADQAKGDGALDCKKSTYVTFSYNHFYDNGKCNLLGLSEGTTDGYYITYHHNWYDHSDSRHPRVRYYSAHVYNNFYDGNAKYGIGACLGCSIFSENNYFQNCKYPMMTSMQGTDVADGNQPTFSKENGGSIKAYGNVIVGAKSFIDQNKDSKNFDAIVVSSRNEKVSSNYKSVAGSNTYNNFDTSSIMYSYTAQSAADAKTTVQQYAGRMNGGDFKWTFTDADNESYAVNNSLMSALKAYKTSLQSVGGNSIPGASSSDVVPTTQATTQAATTTKAATTATTTKAATTTAAQQTTAASTTTSGAKYMFNPSKGLSNSFFTAAGSISTDKGTATVNKTTLSSCLKMDSKGSIKFTTATKGAKLTVYVSGKSSGSALNINGKSAITDIGTSVSTKTYTLGNAGTYEITKGTNETYIFYVILEEAGTTTVSTTAAQQTTKAASTTAAQQTTTAAQSTSSTSTSWNFKNSNFKSLGTISSTKTVDGLGLIATSSKTMSVVAETVTVDGTEYTYALALGGGGSTSYRAIKVPVSGSDVIKVVCRSTGSSSRTLVVADSNGKQLGTITAGSTAALGTYNYSGNAGYVYLYSSNSGINVYKVQVDSKGASSGSTTTTTKAASTTAAQQTTTQSQQTTTQSSSSNSGDIYVSPSGKSSAKGTSSDPMDIVTAISKIQAGKTIWCQSGTYKLSSTILIAESNSGKSGAYKKISSINGGTVTFDFTGMKEEGANRGFVLDGSYWYFYGVDITGAGDNGMLLSGDNNIIELCQFYANHDTGLQLSRYNTNYSSVSQWPSNNLIKNCTAYNNKDDATAENADGFAAKLTCGNGNVFDGCIAYCNSDDGWDLYAKPATGSIGVVTIKNCVAFGNGKLTNGQGSANGDMNGFKLGGSNGQCPTPHVVENCLAFYNGATGFTDNGNGGALKMSNCTAVDNGKYDSTKANYMCYRTSSSASYSNLLSFYTGSVAQSDKFLGKMSNTIYAYKGTGYYKIASGSFSGSVSKQSSTFSISKSDFKSVSLPGYSSGKYATNYHKVLRNSDGSINMNGLFQYKTSGIGSSL